MTDCADRRTRIAAPIGWTVNGAAVSSDVPPQTRLSDVLRETLGLTGTKSGCDAGDCGACTVLLNGEAFCACLTPLAHVAGQQVTTVEGLATEGLSSLQRAFLAHGAAQCGICTPGMLMAASALLNRHAAPSREAIEEALAGVLCRCTGYAKIVSAVMDASTPGPALPTASGMAVGARLERLDGVPKISGADVFGADRWPDDALLVRVVRSPHAAGAFTFGDVEAWRKERPGIIAVFTARDIPGRNAFGVIPRFADQPALADGVVRFRGEAIALLAGERDAVRSIDLMSFPVVWRPKQGAMSMEDALSSTAKPVLEQRPDNILVRGRVATGNADAALEASAFVVSRTVETSSIEHAYIEPEAGAAWMDGETLVIAACTQAPHMDRTDTALVLGLPDSRVRIIPTSTGGGFGSKLDLSVQPLIGLVTLLTGRPSRIIYSRTESMQSTTKRHPARMTAQIGMEASGRISAMVFDGDFDTGPYSSWGPTVANRVPVHASGPYRTPHYRAQTRAIHTNGPVSGAFRGFGVPQAAILQETLYDELADRVGMDRLAFRRLNAFVAGDRTTCGQTLSAPGIVECLDALRPHWDRALADAAQHNRLATDTFRGVGVASCWYGCGNTSLPNPSTIRIGIGLDGRVKLHQGATDIGQGSNTVIAQMAADALGLPVSLFDLIGPDTALTPDCGKTSASRQTFVSGKAAVLAASALREKILRLSNAGAESRIEIDAGTIVVSNGAINQKIALQGLEPDENGYRLSAEESYDPPTTPLDADGQGAPYAVYGYGAQLAEVAVDRALGTVKVLRITAAHDVGRAINPMLAEGQIEGGIAQGLGLALMEEYISGRTENLHDYLIPTIGDMPEIVSILIEKPDPEGPFGAKGLGEHVLIPTAPAILNAIRHATGAVISKLPALPHRVLAAMQEAHR